MITKELKNYNWHKSIYQSFQTPFKAYHGRIKAVFVWKNFTLAQIIPHLFFLAIAPLAYPLFGLPALLGRVGILTLQKCNPKLLTSAMNVIKHARKAHVSVRDIPAGHIRNGNGEFVVFKKQEGRIVPLTTEEHAGIYPLLNTYQFWTSLNHNLSKGAVTEQLTDEHAFVLSKLKAVDPSYEMAFIPRTLYEMAYLDKCVEEDLAWAKGKSNLYGVFHPNENDCLKPERLDEGVKNGARYHYPVFFPRQTPTREDLLALEQNPSVRALHLDFNNHLLNFIVGQGYDPTQLTYTQLRDLSEVKSGLLADCANPATIRGQRIAELWKNRDDYDHLTFTLKAAQSVGRDLNSMTLAPPKKRTIIRKAIQLECSRLAITHALFYRGATRKRDLPVGSYSDPRATQLSFGRSLFAGAVWDSASCAFGFMHDSPDAMVIPIPKRQFHEKTAPMLTVNSSALLQLIGKGDFFHAHFDAHNATYVERVKSYYTLRALKQHTVFLNPIS